MKYISVLLIIISILNFSCSTKSNNSSKEAPEKPKQKIESTENKKSYTTWDKDRSFYKDYKSWQEYIQPISGLPVPDTLPYWVWNNIPSTNQPLFLGFAYPHVNLEKERQVALEHAAMQISRFIEVIGLAQAISVHTKLGLYYGQEVIAHYDDTMIEDILASIDIISEYRDDSGSYLLVTYPGLYQIPKFPVIPENYTIDVTKTLPDIPGYNIAVGSTRKYIRMSDSLIKSDENALAELLKQKEVHIVTQQDIRSIEGKSDIIKRDTYEYATGRIHGFYILARWTDGENYFSMGITPIQ